MKSILHGLAISIALFANVARASEVNIDDANISFSLPDTWNSRVMTYNKSEPKMTPSDPLFLYVKRQSITDNAGRTISPGFNITTFNVSADSDVTLMSNTLMNQRGWPINGFISAEKYGLKLPNSMGYLTEFSPSPGITLKAYAIFAINNGTFVEIVLSEPDSISSQLDPEFRAVLSSLALDK
jgi:hypothetical protein